MSSYSLNATNTSQQSPILRKGTIRIYTNVSVYWVVGENPQASTLKCALLRAGESLELRIPVKCSRIAVLAVSDPGTFSILELGVARPSCSA